MMLRGAPEEISPTLQLTSALISVQLVSVQLVSVQRSV